MKFWVVTSLRRPLSYDIYRIFTLEKDFDRDAKEIKL